MAFIGYVCGTDLDPQDRAAAVAGLQSVGVLIASSNAEQEEAKEELEIDYGGDTIEIGFNVTYLMEVLSNMSQEMVSLSLQDANSSALVTIPEQTGFKYVVMPMRI